MYKCKCNYFTENKKSYCGHISKCLEYDKWKYGLISDTEIISLYNKGFSSNKIAKIFNEKFKLSIYNAGYIIKRLKKCGIITRSIKESHCLESVKQQTKETNLKLYRL